MNDIRFLQDHPVFSTRQFAFLCGRSMSAASRKLARLEAQDVVVKITRGIWCQPSHARFSPNQVSSLLLGNERGYISFLSALHLQGAIAQIPAAIQIATSGHGRVQSTQVGRYELYQVQPAMMRDGFEASETYPPYLIACAEKSLLDTLYISTRKGRRFASLPELDAAAFDWDRLATLFDAEAYSISISSAIKSLLARYFPQRRIPIRSHREPATATGSAARCRAA